MIRAIVDFDLTVVTCINQQWRTELLDFLMPLFSSEWCLAAVAFGLLCFVIYRYGAGHYVLGSVFCIVLLMACTDGGTNLVKKATGRLRPLNSIPGTFFYEDQTWQRRQPDFRATKPRGTSFVSAHAANTMMLALTASFLFACVRKGIWLLPLLVGYSRIYLGKHFLTDVLGGWLFAVLLFGLLLLVFSFFPGLKKKFRRFRQQAYTR